ncbi:hypothetical protein [Galbibacter orientalis]|uniref:hypothetical protein n=1 Tax=Galbibacter orientalis TaxID=453852 RepID=UPI0030806551
MKYPFHIFDNKKEMEVLYQIFQMKEADKTKLEKSISKLLLPAGGVLQSGLSYMQFMEKIASKREITLPVTASIPEKEKVLYKDIVNQNLESMSDEERGHFNSQLMIEAEKKGFNKTEVASMGSLVGIGAAQLSGFGIYMLASSTVATISGLVGVTLPFAFYTTMSSVISFVIGPAGIILAAIPLYKTVKDVRSWDDLKEKGMQLYKGIKVFAKGNYELAEVIFSYFAATRILKLAEYENRYKQYLDEVIVKSELVGNKQKLYDIEDEKHILIKNEIKILEQQLEDLKIKLTEQLSLCNQSQSKVINAKEELKRINKCLENINQQKNLLLQ